MADVKVTVDDKQLREFAAIANEASKSIKLINTALSKEAKTTKEVDAALKRSVQVQNQTAKSWNEVTRIITNQNDALLRANQVKQQETKTAKQRLIILNAEKGSYEAINASLNKHIAELKKLDTSNVKNKKQVDRLTTSIKKEDAALKKLDAQMGRSQRNVGNYRSALRGVATSLMGAFGVVGGLYLFANAIRSAISITRTFEKRSAELAGVLRKTRKQTTLLTEDSIRLNRVTVKTADEVTQLQIAYARLGFNQEAILAYTEGTINASIALNSELGATAELVGAVAKSYKVFDREGANEIMDQLVISTQKSSLNFERLSTALPKVAGAAAVLNIPLSELLAKLSVVQDSTLDASITGTSFRRILTQLSKKGLDYKESLDKILNSTDQVKTATELFGDRAFVAAVALANNQDKVEELSETYDNALGTSLRTALEQLDTFDAKVKLLTSSWQGLIVASGENGALSQIVGTLTDALDIIGGMSGLEAGVKRFSPQLAKLTNEYNGFGDELKEILTLQEFLAENFETIGGSLGAKTNEIISEWVKNQGRLNDEIGVFEGYGLPQLYTALANSTDNYTKSINSSDSAAAIFYQNQINQINEQISKLKELNDSNSESDVVVNRENTIIAKILGLDKIDELKSDLDISLSELADKSIVTIDDILSGNIKLKGSFKDTFNEASEGGRSFFDTLASEQEKLGLQLEESSKKIFIDQYNSRIDENLAKFKDSQETQKDLLKNRLESGIISEQEYSEKVKALNLKARQEEAKAQKKKAIFQIGIDTLTAVIKTFAEFGFPVGVPLAATMAGIGAVKAAAVAAQPIPKFDKGTKNTPDTFMAGEIRPEFVRYKDGSVELLTKPTLFTQSKGMEVISSQQTKMILDGKKDMPYHFDDNRIVNELRNQNNRPIKQTDVTAEGIMYTSRKGNNVTKRLRKL